MNKQNWKGFLLGVLCTVIVASLCVPVFAALTAKDIKVYTGLKIYKDGTRMIPRDVTGKEVEVFAHDGTTYLPVRAISEMLGLNVEWVAAESAVYITEQNSTSYSESMAKLEAGVDEIVTKTIKSLSSEASALIASVDSYAKYTQNAEKITALYKKIQDETASLAITLREYAVAYGELIVNSNLSADDKSDEVEKIYEDIYTDAADDISAFLYESLLDKLYDAFYNGVLDGADATVLSQEYDRWSECRAAIYEEYTALRMDVYEFLANLGNELWDNNVKNANDVISDFKKEIALLK